MTWKLTLLAPDEEYGPIEWGEDTDETAFVLDDERFILGPPVEAFEGEAPDTPVQDLIAWEAVVTETETSTTVSGVVVDAHYDWSGDYVDLHIVQGDSP